MRSSILPTVIDFFGETGRIHDRDLFFAIRKPDCAIEDAENLVLIRTDEQKVAVAMAVQQWGEFDLDVALLTAEDPLLHEIIMPFRI